MYQENMKNKVLSGLFWKVMENGGTQGIQFLVSVLLARMLTPAESGEVMLIMIFITIGNVFVQSGVNTSLIQKRTVDEVDYSSAFYISWAIAFVLYVILFFSAPAIASFYGQPVFTPVLRVLAVTLFLVPLPLCSLQWSPGIWSFGSFALQAFLPLFAPVSSAFFWQPGGGGYGPLPCSSFFTAFS